MGLDLTFIGHGFDYRLHRSHCWQRLENTIDPHGEGLITRAAEELESSFGIAFARAVWNRLSYGNKIELETILSMSSRSLGLREVVSYVRDLSYAGVMPIAMADAILSEATEEARERAPRAASVFVLAPSTPGRTPRVLVSPACWPVGYIEMLPAVEIYREFVVTRIVAGRISVDALALPPRFGSIDQAVCKWMRQCGSRVISLLRRY